MNEYRLTVTFRPKSTQEDAETLLDAALDLHPGTGPVVALEQRTRLVLAITVDAGRDSWEAGLQTFGEASRIAREIVDRSGLELRTQSAAIEPVEQLDVVPV